MLVSLCLDDLRLGVQLIFRITDDAFCFVSRQLLFGMTEPCAEDFVVAFTQRQAGLDRPALRA